MWYRILFLKVLLLTFPMQALSQVCNEKIIASTPDSRFNRDDNSGEVTDLNTGLIWKVCSEGSDWDKDTKTCSTTRGTYTWTAALRRQFTYTNRGIWRLPNVKELNSIVELKCHSPAINLNIFPDNIVDYYWTSSPVSSNEANAWVVNFTHGSNYINTSGHNTDKEQYRMVRLVRNSE